MKKNILFSILFATSSITAFCGSNSNEIQTSGVTSETAEKDVPVVYYIKDINADNLVKIYEKLGREATGKVGVKISSGESSQSNHLDTALINKLVKRVNGRLIECNTAYAGNRNTAEKHYAEAVKHGYLNIDIMDSVGQVELPVTNGFHLKKDIVGKRFLDYDFIVVLSHFKGHQMAGFGGALKNISIGIASSDGKAYIHSAGQTDDATQRGFFNTEQNKFLESMADACQAIISHTGDNILYINVANNLSVDCDCNGNPAKPEMKDFGILASLDPVALDKACIDMVLNSEDHGKEHLIERINSRNGTLTIEAAEKHGLGSQNYKLITLED